MTESVTFSAVLWKEGKTQIAWSPTLDIASQGKNIEEALGNLREAIELYLEDEDAKIPTDRSAFLTTLSVDTHAQTETSLRQ
ncbi:MAG: type II toxin-antitoxin system HicB family antitoxin [Nitrososphaerota archaeon]|nr:type II toxin-antitoxin system HicB family antitoxin [Nitrososphaerota archaeon]